MIRDGGYTSEFLLRCEWIRSSDGARTVILHQNQQWLMCRTAVRKLQPYVISLERFLSTHSPALDEPDVDVLWRRVAGGLKAAINAHGPITKDFIGSATKRIIANLAVRQNGRWESRKSLGTVDSRKSLGMNG